VTAVHGSRAAPALHFPAPSLSLSAKSDPESLFTPALTLTYSLVLKLSHKPLCIKKIKNKTRFLSNKASPPNFICVLKRLYFPDNFKGCFGFSGK
jgi:hypothetical protein